MAGFLSFLFSLCTNVKEEISFEEADYTPQQTTFRLNAPDSTKNVMVRIYDNALSATPEQTVKMKRYGKEMFIARLKGDWKGKFYTFDIGNGETPGVFAKAVGVNGRRAAIVDFKAGDTDPEGWAEDTFVETKSPCDLVIYEMHHRDFSVDESSGLLHKGKFLALTERKAIDHLTRLGINAVHILPSFDYATIDETQLDKPQYNWGYDPLNYNVPEGSYSTDPYDPVCRIREFKQMVQALHKAGIRVILDVVYNHTNSIDGSNFQLTYPDYYYRKDAQGNYNNGSGCGNETASEKPFMRKFMIESMVYWAKEYHVDGFRVDLMGMHDIETMNLIEHAVREVNPSAFIYGEGWSAGQCAYPQDSLAMKANTHRLNNIAAFSDELRDALRGPFNDNHQGAFLAGLPGMEESIKFGIAGAVSHPQVDESKVNYSKAAWAKEPSQMISYVSCHDDMCLVDRLRTSIPGISDEELILLDLLAQTAVMTSQGVPFMLSGEEMLRDKKGVHNSYCSPDSINRLDWTNLEKYPQVFDYYSRLIALRKNHPAFRLGTTELVRRHLEFLPTESNIVAYCLKGNAGGDEWKNIIVILNANKQDKKVNVPQGDYTIVCRGIHIDERGIGKFSGSVAEVPAQSAMIIHE